MYRFFVENNQVKDKEILINGQDVKHIAHVLRLEIGEKIVICNRQGIEYCCIINSIGKDYVKALILNENQSKNELSTKVFLFQGIPKLDKMELIIQKAVELGVYEIVPVMMTRSVVKINSNNRDKKMIRWNKIAESASKQCHRGIIPKVHEPLTFDEALQYAKSLNKVIVPYENSANINESKKILSGLDNVNTIGVFIGPEGGFDCKEIDHLISNQSLLISLGRRILRTETASLAVLSIIMYNLEEE